MSAEMDDPEADLARLVSGELDADTEEGRRILAASGMDAGDLAGLRDLARQLEQVAVRRDAVVREASHLSDAPGMDRVRDALRAAPLPTVEPEVAPWTKRSEARRRWLDWALPLAAAVLLVPLLSQLWSRCAPERPQPTDLLSQGSGASLACSGMRDGYGPVTWSVEEPRAGDEVLLFVYDAEDAKGLAAPLEYELAVSPWTDPAQAAWPDAVRLKLEVRRNGNETAATAWALASRQR